MADAVNLQSIPEDDTGYKWSDPAITRFRLEAYDSDGTVTSVQEWHDCPALKACMEVVSQTQEDVHWTRQCPVCEWPVDSWSREVHKAGCYVRTAALAVFTDLRGPWFGWDL